MLGRSGAQRSACGRPGRTSSRTSRRARPWRTAPGARPSPRPVPTCSTKHPERTGRTTTSTGSSPPRRPSRRCRARAERGPTPADRAIRSTPRSRHRDDDRASIQANVEEQGHRLRGHGLETRPVSSSASGTRVRLLLTLPADGQAGIRSSAGGGPRGRRHGRGVVALLRRPLPQTAGARGSGHSGPVGSPATASACRA